MSNMRESTFLLLTFALLTCCSQPNTNGLPNGFYQLSDKANGTTVEINKCEGKGCTKVVNPQVLMEQSNLDFEFEFGAMNYADTFTIIHITPKLDFQPRFTELINRFEGQDLYYVFNNKILSWYPSVNSIKLELCYCDYSENEARSLEALWNQ